MAQELLTQQAEFFSPESNRSTDIALDPSSYAIYEGEPAGIVRSLKNLAKVFQKPKEVNPV